MISVFIFTSNDFRPWKIEKRERERARRSPTSEQEDRQRRSKKIASEQDDRTVPIVQTHPRRNQSLIIEIVLPFSNHARRERQKEKEEGVERSSHHRRDHLAIVLEPIRIRLPTNPLAPRRRTHHSDEPIRQTHHSDERVFFHLDRAID